MARCNASVSSSLPSTPNQPAQTSEPAHKFHQSPLASWTAIGPVAEPRMYTPPAPLSPGASKPSVMILFADFGMKVSAKLFLVATVSEIAESPDTATPVIASRLVIN